jgi:SAM-dependent methyltransferase
MNPLEKLQHNWEGLAQADPMWAVCADPTKKNGRWAKQEFFATGRNEVSIVLGCLSELGISVDRKSPALDFGCGVGRLTRALAEYFPECCGVDISPTMIRMAREFNGDLSQCRFLLNENDHLKVLPDDYFGFIYTSIVLQHIAETYSRKYIAELIRVLKPGGALVFQIPDAWQDSTFKKVRARLALRSRLQSLIGVRRYPRMEMHCIEETTIRSLARDGGAEVVDVRLTNSVDPAFCGNLRYLQQEPQSGYVSKQYCAVKRR